MLIDQVEVHLAASKNPGYRQRVMDRFRVLVEVFDSNCWLNNGVANRFSTGWERFELHSDDLTAEGMNFVRGNYDSWLRSLDRPFTGKYAEGARKRLVQRVAKHKQQAEQAAAPNRSAASSLDSELPVRGSEG